MVVHEVAGVLGLFENGPDGRLGHAQSFCDLSDGFVFIFQLDDGLLDGQGQLFGLHVEKGPGERFPQQASRFNSTPDLVGVFLFLLTLKGEINQLYVLNEPNNLF